METKYASDVTTDQKIIDKKTDRVVIIEALITDGDRVFIEGYFEDNGDDFGSEESPGGRWFDLDSRVKIV